MIDNGWCDIHEEWVNEGSTCYVCGVAKAERERIHTILMDLYNFYNLKSMDMKDPWLAKFEAIQEAMDRIEETK